MRNIRVEAQDFEAKSSNFLDDCAPNIAKPNDAESLFRKPLRRATRHTTPFSIFDVLVVDQQVAIEHQQEGHRVGTHLVDTVVRHVGDGDSPFACRLQIDHINADAIARNHLAPGQRFDYGAVYFGKLDHQRIGVFDVRNKLVCRREIDAHKLMIQPGLTQYRLFKFVIWRTPIRNDYFVLRHKFPHVFCCATNQYL